MRYYVITLFPSLLAVAVPPDHPLLSPGSILAITLIHVPDSNPDFHVQGAVVHTGPGIAQRPWTQKNHFS